MNLLFDFFWVVFFLVAAFQLPKFFLSSKDEKSSAWLFRLTIFHFMMGVAFFLFTNNGGGDAWGYWALARQMSPKEFLNYLLHGEGTRFMEAFNYIPANIMGMSYFANTMLYALLGFVGILAFIGVALNTVPYNKVLFNYAVFPLIFFLPNLHFWSAGVGKDTVLFMSVGLFAYGLLNPLKRIPLIAVALILAIAIRPHIALFLIASFGIAYFMDSKVGTFQRMAFSVLLLGGAVALLPMVTQFIGVEELSATAVSKRAEGQVGNLAQGAGSAVDVSSYPFPLKVFTYLYRPLFFDARSVGALLSSLDNLILLILSITAFRYRPVETFRKAPFVIKGFLIFGILGTLAFSASLGNLGIMVRMKNMFTPGILIYFMWCYSYRLYLERVVPAQMQNIRKKLKEKSSQNPKIAHP